MGSKPAAVVAPPVPAPTPIDMEALNRGWRKVENASAIGWDGPPVTIMAFQRVESAVASAWSSIAVAHLGWTRIE